MLARARRDATRAVGRKEFLHIVRDPLSLTKKRYDSTGTTDSVSTRGGQYRTCVWQMFVHKGMPLGLKISARGAGDTRRATAITLAEFKLAIHTDVKRP